MIKYEFDPRDEIGDIDVDFTEYEAEEFPQWMNDVTIEVRTAMLAILTRTCVEIESRLPGITEEDFDTVKRILIEETSGKIDLDLLREFNRPFNDDEDISS